MEHAGGDYELNSTAIDFGIDVSGDELLAVCGSARSGVGRFYTATRDSKTSPWGDITPIASLADFEARTVQFVFRCPDALHDQRHRQA